MVVYVDHDLIEYEATFKNDNKNQNADFSWMVSDTSVATIDSGGNLTLTGETGLTLVSCTYNNFKASVELLVIDSMFDLEVNTISIRRVLPNGNELKAKTFKEGETYKIGGLPFPLNILNAGMLHFPFGCIDEDIDIYMFIPEEYAEIDDENGEVNYSEGIVAGVKFSVKPVGSDTIVSPYYFDVPVSLSLVFKHGLLDSLGISPEELDVFFADSIGFEETDGHVAVDTVKNRIYANIIHFSTIVAKQGTTTTSVKDLTPVSEDMLQIYPNPFSTSTNIQFHLADPGHVNITVYNLVGQKVQTLAEGEFHEGMHRITWQGNDMNGAPATSGLYFCRFMKDGNVSKIKKIVLNR